MALPLHTDDIVNIVNSDNFTQFLIFQLRIKTNTKSNKCKRIEHNNYNYDNL